MTLTCDIKCNTQTVLQGCGSDAGYPVFLSCVKSLQFLLSEIGSPFSMRLNAASIKKSVVACLMGFKNHGATSRKRVFPFVFSQWAVMRLDLFL